LLLPSQQKGAFALVGLVVVYAYNNKL
jgi:hypothetical protein